MIDTKQVFKDIYFYKQWKDIHTFFLQLDKSSIEKYYNFSMLEAEICEKICKKYGIAIPYENDFARDFKMKTYLNPFYDENYIEYKDFLTFAYLTLKNLYILENTKNDSNTIDSLKESCIEYSNRIMNLTIKPTIYKLSDIEDKSDSDLYYSLLAAIDANEPAIRLSAIIEKFHDIDFKQYLATLLGTILIITKPEGCNKNTILYINPVYKNYAKETVTMYYNQTYKN